MKIKNSPFLLTVFSLFSIVLIFNSCKKDYDPLDTLPESFTKKVLIEEFTAEWCGACPSAYPRIQTVLDENPNNIFVATIHSNDPFSNNQTSQIKGAFSVSGFPSSMVDRYAFDTGSPRVSIITSVLRSKSELRLGEKVTSGIKIDTELLEGGKANIIVTIGHNKKITGNPQLTVYLLEDNLPAINQVGTSDPNYTHHHVLRKILTEEKGKEISLDAQDRDFHILKFEDIDISEYDKDNLEVIAFIHQFDDNYKNTHEIINTQYVKLGKNQDWD